MTLATLRPDGTVSSTGMGDPTPHVEMADNSTGTTIDASGGSAAIALMTLGTVTLPAGAVTKSLTARTQARGIGGTLPGRVHMKLQKADGTVLVDYIDAGFATASFVTRSSSVVAVTLAQADVDGLRLWVHLNEKQANPYPVIMAEAYADLRYVTVPTIALDTVVTSLDTVTQSWSYSQTDVDGGAQAQWVARVFTAAQYGAGGFDPATSVATAELSGTGTTTSVTLSGVPDGTNHRIYVRAADIVNGGPLWSAWSNNTFTITTTRAQVSAVTATAVPADARVELVVSRDTGQDAWTGVEIERAATLLDASLAGFEATAVSGVAGGWEAASSGVVLTPTIQTAAGRGNVQRLSYTGLDPGEWAYVRTASVLPLARIGASGGDVVDVSMWASVAAGTFIAGTRPGFVCDWYAGAALVSSTSQSTSGGGTAGLYYQWSLPFAVPAGATGVKVSVGAYGGAAASNSAGQIDVDAVTVTRVDGWNPVAGSEFAASGNSLTVSDRLVPPDQPQAWRARAFNAAGAAGVRVYVVASLSGSNFGLRLRDAASPTTEWSTDGWEIDGFPDDSREIPSTSLDVIGRTDPVVVYDVPKYGTGRLKVECLTLADSDGLVALLDGRSLMVLQPSVLGPSMLIHPTRWVRERGEGQIATERRYVTIDYQQVG